MSLFTSDDDLQNEQKAAARVPKGVILTPEQERAERMEQQRELREHQRWRQFAFLLFVAPFLMAILIVLAQWIGMRLAAGATP